MMALTCLHKLKTLLLSTTTSVAAAKNSPYIASLFPCHGSAVTPYTTYNFCSIFNSTTCLDATTLHVGFGCTHLADAAIVEACREQAFYAQTGRTHAKTAGHMLAQVL